MAKEYDPEELKKATTEWKAHHELVSLVRRLVKKSGGVQEV